MNDLSDSPINSIIGIGVIVTDPAGAEFHGKVEAASSRYLDARYITGNKGQFDQVRRFRRKTLRGYDAGWSVRAAAISDAPPISFPGKTHP